MLINVCVFCNFIGRLMNEFVFMGEYLIVYILKYIIFLMFMMIFFVEIY